MKKRQFRGGGFSPCVLDRERQEWEAQAAHIEFLKRKNLRDSILNIMEKTRLCYSDACKQAGLAMGTGSRMRQEDVMFNWKVERILNRRISKKIKHKQVRILELLRVGQNFKGACYAVGINEARGYTLRMEYPGFNTQVLNIIHDKVEARQS